MAETIVAGSLPTTESTVDSPNGGKIRIVNGGSFRGVYGKPDEATSEPTAGKHDAAMEGAMNDVARIMPNLAKMAPYTSANDAPKPTTIRSYSGNGKELLYINGSHVSDIDNPTPTQKETLDRVREAIEEHKPKAVVIEAKKGTPLSGEQAYTAQLAAQNGIPVVRAEPDDKAIFDGMRDSGYSTKDLMALYTLRQVAQDRTRKDGKGQPLKMDEESVAQRIRERLADDRELSSFRGIPAGERLTYEEFKAVYAPKLGGKDYKEATPEDFKPISSPDATYFQRLSAELTPVRERAIDKTIADTLNGQGTDTVLVVYGGAHRTISEPVWEAALGKGKDISTAKAEPQGQGQNITDDHFQLAPNIQSKGSAAKLERW